MAYEKTNWIDKTPTNSGTPINADNLNKIEEGIEAAWDKISEVYKGEITTAESNDTKESGMYKLNAIIVGSDQVWRPKYNTLENTFLSFVKSENQTEK